MKLKKIVQMIEALLVLLSVILIVTACPNRRSSGNNEPNKPDYGKTEYTKEEFTFKFKNESDATCYVEIKGNSSNSSIGSIHYTEDVKAKIDFPTVLRTEISAGTERSITVKDVVVSAKNKLKTYKYEPRFTINVSKSTSNTDVILNGDKSFTSSSKEQYTKGTFIITKERDHGFYNSYKFEIEFKN